MPAYPRGVFRGRGGVFRPKRPTRTWGDFTRSPVTLQASVAGSGSVTATLEPTWRLSATVSGVAVVILRGVGPTRAFALRRTASAGGSTLRSATRDDVLRGSTSTATTVVKLMAEPSGTSSVAAVLPQLIRVAASVVGAAVTTAAFAALRPLAAATVGTAVVAAAVRVQKLLVAAAAGVGTVTTTLSTVIVAKLLAAVTGGTSATTAIVRPVRGITATFSGTSTVTSAPPYGLRGLSAAADGAGIALSTMSNGSLFLSATVSGTSTVTGRVVRWIPPLVTPVTPGFLTLLTPVVLTGGAGGNYPGASSYPGSTLFPGEGGSLVLLTPVEPDEG